MRILVAIGKFIAIDAAGPLAWAAYFFTPYFLPRCAVCNAYHPCNCPENPFEENISYD